MNTQKLSPPQKLVLPYLIIGILYILFSDKLVQLAFANSDTITTAQTYKGLAFVMLTGAMIYMLSKEYTSKVTSVNRTAAFRDEFYRALIVNAGDLTILTDRNGMMQFTGPSIKKLLGYTDTELLKVSVFEFVHPADLQKLQIFHDEIVSHPDHLYTCETRIRHKNGDYLWMEGTIVNKLNDPIIGGIVTTARITNARRLEEDKIKASERLFRSAFEQVAVGMANLSLGGEWIRMNDQICKIIGYTHDELSGTRYEKLYNSEDQAAAITEFRNITGGKKQDQCTTRKFLKKDGSSIWVECLLTLISDEQQQPLYIAVVVKDIDVARRTEHQLEYRNKELDTFIYRSSHDLRGPITTLMGLSDIARLDAPDEKTRDYFTDCYNVAKKMEKTLRDLMAVTQIKQGAVVIKEITPRVLLYTHLNSKKINGSLGDISLCTEVNDDAKYYSDESLFRLIVSHLVDNAIAFTNPLRSAKVFVSIQQKDQKINLIVMDNGIGIPEDEAGQIFDLYFRGRNVQRGSGIGLYLVKSAIEKLGGTIDVSSSTETGTKVIVSLPNNLPVS